MTLTRFRELVALIPFRNDRFGVQNRLLSFIDRELIDIRGPEAEAPKVLWDDHGVTIYSEYDEVAIYFGARVEGHWVAMPKRAPEPSNEREGDVATGHGVVHVV
jgi:hypothetical protein